MTKEEAKYFPWLRGSVAKTKCNFDQYSSVAKWLYFSLDPWLKKKHNIYPWLRGSVAKNKSNVCTPGSVALWLKKRLNISPGSVAPWLKQRSISTGVAPWLRGSPWL